MKKTKIEVLDDVVRIEIPKENVMESEDVSVAIIHKPKAKTIAITDEEIRECGEALASSVIILLRAKHHLEKGEIDKAEKLLSSAPTVLIHAAKKCRVEFPGEISVEVLEIGEPREIKEKLQKMLEMSEEEGRQLASGERIG